MSATTLCAAVWAASVVAGHRPVACRRGPISTPPAQLALRERAVDEIAASADAAAKKRVAPSASLRADHRRAVRSALDRVLKADAERQGREGRA